MHAGAAQRRAPALAWGCDSWTATGHVELRSKTRGGRVSLTRAVVRGVEPGNDVRCVRCGKQIKFAARTTAPSDRDVYLDGAWNRVDHFHEECYLRLKSLTGRSTRLVARPTAEGPRSFFEMRIVVTGASGFIGSALVRALSERGDEVCPVVRHPARPGEVGIDLAGRRLDTSQIEGGNLEGIDAAVHLAGASITGRWSAKRLEDIRASRVALGDLLARFLASLKVPPAVLVSGSAVGIYGDRGDEVLDEQSPQGTGVLADLCRAWEASTLAAQERADSRGHDPDRHRPRRHSRGRRGNLEGRGPDLQARSRRPPRRWPAVDELGLLR